MTARLLLTGSREAAYLAVLKALREEGFIYTSLEQWRQSSQPTSIDYNLAQEIAYGTCRMALALDFLGATQTNTGKLNLKLKERTLLRTTLYQHFFMQRIPLYAIADESLKIAKKYCHSSFAGFLNAALRKLSDKQPSLPQQDTIKDLSIRLSYPQYFVRLLINEYGLTKAKEILEVQNRPSPTMVRIRTQASLQENLRDSLEMLPDLPVAIIKDNAILQEIAASPNFYIQNATPVSLVQELSRDKVAPHAILDLCASPGGKLIAAYDCFPNAQLTANDVSEEKLKLLKENIAKYQLTVTLKCSLGEHFTTPTPFDLIILDVPCSNSGVLNKRPEARWRLSDHMLEELEKTQLRLADHAISLLTEGGELWYITCSILKRENEEMVTRLCQRYSLQVRKMLTILPNEQGFDGGFACALIKET